MEEGNDKGEFQGEHGVVGDLAGDDVEPEEEGHGETQDGGASEQGVDADEESGGDAPGQRARAGSHAQQREDGQDAAAVDPGMVDRTGGTFNR